MPEFKNIVGTAFPKYVKDQLEQRKKLLTSALTGSSAVPNTRNNTELQWLTNRTGWYRMSSGAKLGDSDTLAKNNVLQGGLIKTTDGAQTTMRKGFNATYTNLQNDDLGMY